MTAPLLPLRRRYGKREHAIVLSGWSLTSGLQLKFDAQVPKELSEVVPGQIPERFQPVRFSTNHRNGLQDVAGSFMAELLASEVLSSICMLSVFLLPECHLAL